MTGQKKERKEREKQKRKKIVFQNCSREQEIILFYLLLIFQICSQNKSFIKHVSILFLFPETKEPEILFWEQR